MVTSVSYSYRPIADDGTVLDSVSAVTDARLPGLDSELARASESVGVLKAIVLWNMVASFQKASDLYYGVGYNESAALEQIEALANYVDDANAVLQDEEIAKDRVELINQFAMNLGGYLGDSTWEGTCAEYSSGGCLAKDHAYEDGMHFGCAATTGNGIAALAGFAFLAFGQALKRVRRTA